MTTQIIPFSFDTHPVRTLLINNQPWFVAADIAIALVYRDSYNMCRNLDDDEKGTQIVSTPSGEQEMLVINESGLYSAILRSRKAEAKRFKKWVTAEVLPAIRQHGRYEASVKSAETKRCSDRTVGLRQAVSLLVSKKALPYPTCYNLIHQRFAVNHINELSAEQLPLAVEYVHKIALDGEWLAADAMALSHPAAKQQFSTEELYQFGLLVNRAEVMRRYINELLPLLAREFDREQSELTQELGTLLKRLQC